MKITILTLLSLCLISTHAMVGTNQAVEAYLDSEFRYVSNVSELDYLGQTDSCDEVVDIFVIGNQASGETAYSCNICLINDGGIATVNSQESFCLRD
jgi:hypothetical protein